MSGPSCFNRETRLATLKCRSSSDTVLSRSLSSDFASTSGLPNRSSNSFNIILQPRGGCSPPPPHFILFSLPEVGGTRPFAQFNNPTLKRDESLAISSIWLKRWGVAGRVWPPHPLLKYSPCTPGHNHQPNIISLNSSQFTELSLRNTIKVPLLADRPFVATAWEADYCATVKFHWIFIIIEKYAYFRPPQPQQAQKCGTCGSSGQQGLFTL